MLREGLETIENVRRRFDGERRNPWDEPECGHHYARAMSAWSTVVAFSGFEYHASGKAIRLMPKTRVPVFASFFSTGLGWGLFSIQRNAGPGRIEIGVTEGRLPLRSIRLGQAAPGSTSIALDGRPQAHQVDRHDDGVLLTLAEDVIVPAGGKLIVLL